MMSLSLGDESSKLFGTIHGISSNGIMKDTENTEFTDFVANNYNKLCRYAETLNIDTSKNEDLVHDLWRSYKINEENCKCYDPRNGHGLYIDLEESVKARMKRMAKNKLYLRHTDCDEEVLAHFTADTEEDSVQNDYTNMCSTEDLRVDEAELFNDLEENMMYFIACTARCRVTGLAFLEKLDTIVKTVDNGLFDAEFVRDLWIAGEDIKDTFRSIFKAFSLDIEAYTSTLQRVREEVESCRQNIMVNKTI